jgi:hypothetical protein
MNLPVVLPVVAITVDQDGVLSARLDGQPYADQRQLLRGDLRGLLAEITSELATPIRVEVAEADGTTYADISTPPGDDTTQEGSADALPIRTLPGVTGSGFRPGEQVAVAYILLREIADDTGEAVVRLPPAVLSRHQGALVLLGLDANTVTPLNAPLEATA